MSMAEPVDSPPSTEHEERPATLQRQSTADQPKTCWICYSDSTEDDESTSATWRTPCPCALTAHEACLLDWVADLENPKNRKGTKAEKIQCPQCKAEIKISRPKSFVVDGMKTIDRVGRSLTFPGVICTFGCTIWAGAFWHGFQTIYVVFGDDDAERILEHAALHRIALPIGLPLIPISLIMSRTRYSDFVLPFGTIFLLGNQLYDGLELDYTIWPPTASTTFAWLPLVRNGYNYIWERAFGPLERKWMAEIQPRSGQDADADHNDNNNNALGNMGDQGEIAEEGIEDGDVLLEVNLDIGIGGGDDGEEEEEGADDAAPPPPPIRNPNAADQANPQPANNNDDPMQQPADNPAPAAAAAAAPLNAGNAAQNANALVLETSSLATTVLGALFFPYIATGVGEILRLTLPTHLTTPPSTNLSAIIGPKSSPFSSEALSHIWSMLTGGGGARAGEKTAQNALSRLPLLQTRWGRTVVGGCLFVVVKDFFTLYWRWRLARNHRERRVMDWDRAKGTWTLPGK